MEKTRVLETEYVRRMNKKKTKGKIIRNTSQIIRSKKKKTETKEQQKKKKYW